MKKKFLPLALLAAAIALGWLWLERSTRPESDVAPSLPGKITSSQPASPPTLAEGAKPTATDATTAANSNGSGSETALPTETPATSLTAGDILAEPDDDYVRVAKKLSVLVRDAHAPMADREEALAHALNLSAGNEAEVLTPLVTDPAVPDPFAETILAEALNRPLAFQADLYLAALAVRKSPEMQKLIRDHLAFLTGGDDLGSNPAAWVPAINTVKKDWE